MCTSQCLQPADAALTRTAQDALADLLSNPIVRVLAAAFASAHGQLWVVGGPTRGALLGQRDFADLDFTTDLRPDSMRPVLQALGTVWDAGESFGTLAVNITADGQSQKVEVTTFRTETYETGSRKPTVGFGTCITDDLRRRDLTVNAIAVNVISGCLLDPFGGITALSEGVLDTPDDPDRTFTEDPLRILRVVRFAARLGFTPTPRVTAACRRNADRLKIVSAERRTGELDKLGEYGGTALREGLQLADSLEVLQYFIPAATVQDRLRTLAQVSADADVDVTIAVSLAPSTADSAVEVTALRSHLTAMKLKTTRIKRILTAVQVAQQLRRQRLSVVDARSLLRDYDDATLHDAAVVARALGAGEDVAAPLAEVLAAEPAVRSALPVSGEDLLALGLRGPAIGNALRQLEQLFRSSGQAPTLDQLDLTAV